MSVLMQVNPVSGDNFFVLSTKSLANDMVHPDNFYATEMGAYEGQKELAEYMLAYVEEQDSERGKGRRPHVLGDWEHEANVMLVEYKEFVYNNR